MDFKVRCTYAATNCFTKNKIYTVSDNVITDDLGYTYKRFFEDCMGMGLASEFELVEDTKMFEKKDLKVGMVVEYRNGWKRVVTETTNGMYFWSKDGSVGAELFNDDLTDKARYTNDLTIVRVWGLSESLAEAFTPETKYRKLLWERKPEITTLSMKEIADKFNIPVESLRVSE